MSGFKIEVLDVDMRALSMFNNDTVYIVSFSVPQYLDDQATFLKTAAKNQNNSQ